jgi:hypothetical protein
VGAGLLSGLSACSTGAQCEGACSGRGGVGGAGGITVAGAGGIGGTGRGGSQPIGVGGTGAYCGQLTRPLTALPPDILILLDRSGSMNNDITDNPCIGDGGISIPANGSCGASSKWALVTSALNQVVGETDTAVNWGLKFFPDVGDSSCTASGAPAVSIGSANGTAIASAIAGQTTAVGAVMGSNGTPTNAGETSAAAYLATLTDANPKFILLATDGLPTCATGGVTGSMSNDSAGAIAAVQTAFNAGIPTFVVGIATAGFTGDTTLSEMANAGGYPRTGSPSYYPVSTTQELTATLSNLVATVATECTFALGPPPTNDGRTGLDRINIFVDGAPLARDPSHTRGWDYTDATKALITVYGPDCNNLLNGVTQWVTVAFTCIDV